MDKLILVLYFDVADLDEKMAEELTYKVSRKMFTPEIIEKLDATTFVIPIRGGGSRIECINPKFIVDQDVYRDYRLKLDILNENVVKYLDHGK